MSESTTGGSQENPRRVPLERGLFTGLDDSAGAIRLIGCRCPGCGKVLFPKRARCSVCGHTPTEELLLNSTGKVHSCTIFRHHRKPPGYEGTLPYSYGRVELPEGVGILTRMIGFDLEAPLPVGADVELTLESMGKNEDGEDIVSFAFRPIQPATPGGIPDTGALQLDTDL